MSWRWATPLGAAALLSRAMQEPPAESERAAVLLALGKARARAGIPEAVVPLREVVEHGEEEAAIAAAAAELSGMLFAGRARRERRSCAAPSSGCRPSGPLASSSR